MHQRKFDEAVAAYRAAVEKDPEMSAAWYRIGVAKTAKNGEVACEAAYKPFKRCVELNPNHAGAHCALGEVLLHVRKDDVRAEKQFRAATRIDPNFAPASCDWTRSYATATCSRRAQRRRRTPTRAMRS